MRCLCCYINDEKYFFFYTEEGMGQVPDALQRAADDPELSFAQESADKLNDLLDVEIERQFYGGTL